MNDDRWDPTQVVRCPACGARSNPGDVSLRHVGSRKACLTSQLVIVENPDLCDHKLPLPENTVHTHGDTWFDSLGHVIPGIVDSNVPHSAQSRTSGVLTVDPNGAPMPIPNDNPHVQDLVIEDIHARRELGIQRYGTGLQPFNGRNALRDLYEELLDAACYARQRLEEEAQRPAQIVVADDLELIEGILDIYGTTSALITRDVKAGVVDEEDDLFVPVSKIAETLRRIRSRPTARYALVSDLVCLSCGAPTLVTPTSSPTDTPQEGRK